MWLTKGERTKLGLVVRPVTFYLVWKIEENDTEYTFDLTKNIISPLFKWKECINANLQHINDLKSLFFCHIDFIGTYITLLWRCNVKKRINQ